MRTAVVTGGAGFIGTNLTARLVEDGAQVVVLDDLSRRGSEGNLRFLRDTYGRAVRFERGDVRDPAVVRRAVEGADRVYHLAAQVAVTTSLDDPVADFDVNLRGTLTVLEALRRLDDPPFLLFTSTNKVYGALPDLPLALVGGRWLPTDAGLRANGLSEERPLEFCTPYGCSKGAADQYVLDYAKSFGLPATVFRMSCIYGPHQNGTEDQGWVAHFALRAAGGRAITVYGDGSQVRDLLFVDDLVEAMQLAREHERSVTGRAFNIGGGAANALSVGEVLELLEASGVRRAEERLGDQRYYVADTRSFQEATGWAPLVGVHHGIERLVRFLAPVEAAA
ncbi:MAG TPA: SDR family NAD(P)-dependent oxidoreductase [Gaiellaceae bacterium]|nr:SDR family NAD(P)-dependent oxidoreductase [Gaiellaceae bacterium]